MKRTALLLSLFFISGAVFADQYVSGHYRKDGTYVQGYSRSSPDEFRYNNRNSQTNGGYQRDEFSSGNGATNMSNSSYGWRDNNNNGILNSFDKSHNSGFGR